MAQQHTKNSNKAPTRIYFRKPCTPEQIADTLASVSLSSTQLEVTGNGPWEKFEDMGLNYNLVKGIAAQGWEKPAKIQQLAIVPCIRGKDLVLQAQSGMGKTGALCIGILQRLFLLEKSSPGCQALVLAPTRELAVQITQVFQLLGGSSNLRCISCIGGTKTNRDKERLSSPDGVSIVVGTVGRIHRLSVDPNPVLLANNIKIFAMDEADTMLTDDSIKNDLCEIVNTLVREDAQIILMSATMPKMAVFRAKELMRNPEFFLISNEELTLEGIRQYYIDVEDESKKLDTLFDLRDLMSHEHTIVFCNTRKKVRKLTKALEEKILQSKENSSFSSTHGELEQWLRNSALQEFRSNATRLLITSNLMGRGIDIQHVSLVINYDLPDKTEDYIHRVGRGGRYGRQGVAISFITNLELDHLKQICEFYNTEIPPMPQNIYN